MFDRVWPFWTVLDNFWPFLTVLTILTVFDRIWPYLTVFDYCWPFFYLFDRLRNNGPIWSYMVQTSQKWSRMIPNLSKIIQKGPNDPIWSNMVQICLKNHRNGSGITRSPGLVCVKLAIYIIRWRLSSKTCILCSPYVYFSLWCFIVIWGFLTVWEVALKPHSSHSNVGLLAMCCLIYIYIY